MLLFKDYPTYRAFIEEHFGPRFYAYDNVIVDEEQDGEEVATLGVLEDGVVYIRYLDGRPDKIAGLEGAKP